jgi:SAM-dependent MidA family methyltransferase
MTLEHRIAELIRREGPILFADFMAVALYDEPDGFFSRGDGAGRAGRDFVTSPEVGTLFGALVARSIDDTWRRLGEPDPFVVIEAGAGRGRLASDVLRANPACARALRYVLVERSAVLRASQRDLLTLEPIDEALGPFARATDPGDPDEPVAGVGPIVTSLDELPAIHVDGLVIANELLDNLPFCIAEWGNAGWLEVRVGLALDGEHFVENLVPAAPELAASADEVADGLSPKPGDRLPVPTATQEWIASVANVVRRGKVVLLDYAAEANELLERAPQGWLRTYRGHERGTGPLDAPGTQDITSDVPLAPLRLAARRAGFEIASEATQAAWLQTLGIEELVSEGDARWRERAHVGDLEALAARSRGTEAAALTDPAGLGAHRVVILDAG